MEDTLCDLGKEFDKAANTLKVTPILGDDEGGTSQTGVSVVTLTIDQLADLVNKSVEKALRDKGILNDQLYKCGFFLPLLKCITPEQGQKVLDEIHDRVCGNHIGGQALVYKTIR
ncbi:hypothetical protein ACS0TY_013809 [Phlomoides rotata]